MGLKDSLALGPAGLLSHLLAIIPSHPQKVDGMILSWQTGIPKTFFLSLQTGLPWAFFLVFADGVELDGADLFMAGVNHGHPSCRGCQRCPANYDLISLFGHPFFELFQKKFYQKI